MSGNSTPAHVIMFLVNHYVYVRFHVSSRGRGMYVGELPSS